MGSFAATILKLFHGGLVWDQGNPAIGLLLMASIAEVHVKTISYQKVVKRFGREFEDSLVEDTVGCGVEFLLKTWWIQTFSQGHLTWSSFTLISNHFERTFTNPILLEKKGDPLSPADHSSWSCLYHNCRHQWGLLFQQTSWQILVIPSPRRIPSAYDQNSRTLAWDTLSLCEFLAEFFSGNFRMNLRELELELATQIFSCHPTWWKECLLLPWVELNPWNNSPGRCIYTNQPYNTVLQSVSLRSR